VSVTDRQTDRQTHRQTHRQTRHIVLILAHGRDRETDKHAASSWSCVGIIIILVTSRQTDRQTKTYAISSWSCVGLTVVTDRQTDTHTPHRLGLVHLQLSVQPLQLRLHTGTKCANKYRLLTYLLSPLERRTIGKTSRKLMTNFFTNRETTQR